MRKIYYTTGALPVDHPTYIRRESDDWAMHYFRARDSIYTIAPRQMGKTSLMKRMADELQREGWSCCSIDLASLGKNLGQEVWFQRVAHRIAKACNMDLDTTHICDQDMLRDFLVKKIDIEGNPSRNVALFLDEIEGLLNAPFSDEFFMTLRDIYQNRDQYKGNIYYMLSGFIDPANIVKDPNISIFGIAKNIHLQDLTSDQSDKLIQYLKELPVEIHPQVSERIYYWAGGQPYLTQGICKCVEDNCAMKGLKEVTPEVIDQIVKNNLLNPHTLDPNLKQILQMMLRIRVQRAEKIRGLLAGTLKSSLPGYYELYRTGAVVEDERTADEGDDSGVRVRNRLYTMILQGLMSYLKDSPDESAMSENVQGQACVQAAQNAGRYIVQSQALETARRSLAILEVQAAAYTSLAIPTHLQIALEDKRNEVARLKDIVEQDSDI